MRASSWSYEDGNTPVPVTRGRQRPRLDNDNLGLRLRELELAVSLAEDRLGQVGFLLSALGRERQRTEDNRPGPADSAQTRQVLMSDIETYIRQIGECTLNPCFHRDLTLHTSHLLESGQNTLAEVAESLKSVLRSHMRTEMGEDNLPASQSHLPTGRG